MKIEIKSVTPGEFEEVDVLHIYPHSTQMNFYRRYAPDHWDHDLGLHGWNRYMVTELLEEAYQMWLRENGTKARNK